MSSNLGVAGTLHALAVLLGLALLATNVRALELAEEAIPVDEARDIEMLGRFVVTSLMKSVAVETGSDRRAFHSKAHACVHAVFTVNDRIPTTLKVGVFAKPKRFNALVRLSNGLPGIKADDIPDTRGFAIKLLDVGGPKLLPGHEAEETQDFLLSSGRVFFLRNVRGFVEVGIPLFSTGRVPAGFAYESALIRATISVEPDLLRSDYWSQTPYLLGAKQAVKYRAMPCPRNPTGGRTTGGADVLRARLGTALASEGACFRFQVQRQSNPLTMPIEDPTIEWSVATSPFVDVAMIDIPRQTVDRADRGDRCENLSFNPWHSKPEHRPLGGINRARKPLYDASSVKRHAGRGIAEQEPSASAATPRR